MGLSSRRFYHVVYGEFQFCLLGGLLDCVLLVDAEGGRDMSLRNLGLFPRYTALQPECPILQINQQFLLPDIVATVPRVSNGNFVDVIVTVETQTTVF
jgi:hypothetical protein